MGGGLEPAAAGSGNLDAEVDPVASHDRHHRTVWYVCRGLEHGVTGGHGNVEKEVVVGADECDHPLKGGLGEVTVEHGGKQLAQEQPGGGHVAVVDLIAHVQRLGHQRAQRQPLRPVRQRVGQDRAQLVAHPGQTVKYRFVVGPEAQHRTQTLVEVTEAASARGSFLHHPQRHGWANHPGHRPHRPVVMARLHLDLALAQLADGAVGIGGPAF